MILLHIGICDDNEDYAVLIAKIVNDYFSNQYQLDNQSFIKIETLEPSQLANQIEQKKCSYDILFMDIDMGEYNGISMAKVINQENHDLRIIFISNHLKFATEVYDTRHLYFVLKSEAEIRIPKSLHAACEHYIKTNSKKIVIKYQGLETILLQKDICYVEVFGRYLYIHSGSESYQCIETLKSIESRLNQAFCRCHKSILVNMDYIRHLNRTKCELITGEVLPVSLTYYQAFHDSYLTYITNSL